jgi:hypothetical protein
MKKLIFLFVYIISPILSFSQIVKYREYISVPYQYEIKTIVFKVLDINYKNNLVAFKHIFKLLTFYDEEGNAYQKPYNCKYAGMQKYPEAGVILGVYDLSKQEYLKTFVIYNAASQQSECSKIELSKIMLDSAKQFFKEKGLDISRKPSAIYFKDLGNQQILDYEHLYFEAESYRDDESNDMLTLSILKATDDRNGNSNAIYVINQQDHFEMASSSQIKYIAAYKKGNKIIFLNLFHHITGMDQTEVVIYHFSPVFDLTNIFD